jgi:hypothetical protein
MLTGATIVKNPRSLTVPVEALGGWDMKRPVGPTLKSGFGKANPLQDTPDRLLLEVLAADRPRGNCEFSVGEPEVIGGLGLDEG